MDKLTPASPLPWHTGGPAPVVCVGSGDPIAVMLLGGKGFYAEPMRHQNAAYIVRAANAFPELLAALKAIVKADEAKSVAAIVEAMPAARAAITKAEQP